MNFKTKLSKKHFAVFTLVLFILFLYIPSFLRTTSLVAQEIAIHIDDTSQINYPQCKQAIHALIEKIGRATIIDQSSSKFFHAIDQKSSSSESNLIFDSTTNNLSIPIEYVIQKQIEFFIPAKHFKLSLSKDNPIQIILTINKKFLKKIPKNKQLKIISNLERNIVLTCQHHQFNLNRIFIKQNNFRTSFTSLLLGCAYFIIVLSFFFICYRFLNLKLYEQFQSNTKNMKNMLKAKKLSALLTQESPKNIVLFLSQVELDIASKIFQNLPEETQQQILKFQRQ